MSAVVPMKEVDIAIIGGGMVGASLALALSQTSLSVLLVEGVPPGSRAQPSFDERTTALGNGSRRIFESLGVWEEIAAESAAITRIHVSEAGRLGVARLEAKEQGIGAFGFVAPNRVIGNALWRKLERSRVSLRVPARPEGLEIQTQQVRFEIASTPEARLAPATRESVSARLIVAADGAQSSVRQVAGIEAQVEDYAQVAVIANVAADRAHDGTAYERFTSTGPLAVLPLRDGSYTVVWTLAPERATEVMQLDDATFLRQLQECFGWRAGSLVRVGTRGSYPLKLTRSMTSVAQRAVLIGNAAQALHPVAGQGFNLGLRDAAMLAEVLAGSRGDPGSAELLQKFAAWRAADRRGVTAFTDGLVKLFGTTRPGMGTLRNFGLLLFDLSSPAKSALARVSAGFGGPTPRLARGLTL